MTGGVQQGPGDSERVGLVQCAHGFSKIYRHALGDARGEPQHLALARRADQLPVVERHDRSLPVHDGHRRAVRALDDVDEPDEVISKQPAAVLDEELYGRFNAERPLGLRPKRPREVLEAGSK
jgi:hypothetical protein